MNKESETARDQQDLRHRPSHLFLLRVWLGEAEGQEDWHGRVQHAVTGEAHYFHGCLELHRVLCSMIPHSAAGPAGETVGDGNQEEEA